MESAVQEPKSASNADGYRPEAPMAVGISSTGNGRTTFVRGEGEASRLSAGEASLKRSPAEPAMQRRREGRLREIDGRSVHLVPSRRAALCMAARDRAGKGFAEGGWWELSVEGEGWSDEGE
jgi:hypothetical protein